MSTDEILTAYPELEKEDIDDISARFRNLPITRET
jgi:uncharacterized protein (DUF433 family)